MVQYSYIGIFYSCILVSKIYTLQDCWDYDPMTSNSGKFTLSGGTANIVYSNDGCSFTGTQNSNIFYLYNGTLPTNYIFEMDIVSMSKTNDSPVYSAGAFVNNCSILQDIPSNKWAILTTKGNTKTNSPLAPYHLKVVVEGSKITVYGDNTQLYTETFTTTQCGLIAHNGRICVVKNFKIKPL